jgi:hypothetical protein
MRKRSLAALIAATMLISAAPISHAALDAPINLDNPRVVPIWGAQSEAQGASNRGWWSGYLYSSRIVLTAAHSTYTFDSNGNRQVNEPPFIMVGKPNSNVKDPIGAVKVIKTFVGDYKLSKFGMGVNDFIVYVLEKDLVPMPPSKLMTVDIERELVTGKSEVSYHGYGEYRDRCAPGEKAPCKKDWNNPNQSGSELPRVNKINLAATADFTWMTADVKADLESEAVISNHKACSGDSGGPITTMYQGVLLYLGQGLNGSNVYACGAGNAQSKDNDLQSYGFFSPVHKHLDLIKEAEALVKAEAEAKAKAEAEAKAKAEAAMKKKSTIICTKGKLVKKVTAVIPKCPKGYKKK